MLSQLFLQAPVAMMLIDPFNNRVLQTNCLAQRLLLSTEAPDESVASNDNSEPLSVLIGAKVSDLFSSCFDSFIVFTQKVLAKNNAWSDQLSVQTERGIISIEVTASLVNGQILMCFEDHMKNYGQRFDSKIDSLYREGFEHWNRNETIFQQIERKNQLLLTAVGDGIYGVDTNGCATFVNRAAERILGWSKEHLIGVNVHDAIHHSHSDGAEYQSHACPIFAAFHDGEVHSVDSEVFWSKSGKAIPVEYTSTPVTDENGVLIGAVVVFRDITERKKTEAKLLKALAQVDSLKQRLEMENAYLKSELDASFNHHQIIGKSAQVQHMVHQIDLVAPTNANVLIIGESGTGKELIARAIHEASERKARPLIRVNCAAIPADLFESEFFGHVKGAFSGAVSDRLGRFELADGGTIFLDEVGEIPLQLQGKLLRVLQEQQFERVGDSKTRNLDVRVIAATNQELKALVAANKFREDLYFRLNVFPITSPPLRERQEDLPLLVEHFIRKVCMRFKKPVHRVSLAQMQYLEQYAWPGNIRELENIIERQVILADSDKLQFEFLAMEKSAEHGGQFSAPAPKLISAVQQKQMDLDNLKQALALCKGKVYGEGGAAELLGMKPTTLASKLKKYHIDKSQFIS